MSGAKVKGQTVGMGQAVEQFTLCHDSMNCIMSGLPGQAVCRGLS